MRVDDLHYDLPSGLIAQHPALTREAARLMHLPPDDGEPQHRHVHDLPDLLPAGALVVLNDTRVIPARLIGRKLPTGGRVELLLVRRLGERLLEIRPGEQRATELWHALGKATKPLRAGTDVEVAPRRSAEGDAPVLFARVVDKPGGDEPLTLALWNGSGGPVDAALAACGHVPLPPYIRRPDEPGDRERYQTVYARHDGAVAAPTAGLHLTESLIERIAARGCTVACVTLHVGLGTFRPVAAEDLDHHPMHSERYCVGQETAEAVARARAGGARVVAIGTTNARALESAADPERRGLVRTIEGDTRILIQPGHPWRVVDGLLTNFHLPRSTLLAMVGALGGLDRVLAAYGLAVRERYRFFSYGDAMLLWRRS
jgi:S-adenosylmethionine:tRNA ribosyltransferase-isomerase